MTGAVQTGATGKGSETVYRYLAILACSTMGQWMLRVGLGWTAWEVTESAFWTGLVSSLNMAPSLLLMPVFGVWADRIPLRRAIPVIVLVFLAICLFLAVTISLGLLKLPLLIASSAAFGISSAIYHPFRVTVPARIDASTPLPKIIGMTAIVFNTSGIIGPAIAGGLLALYGGAAVFAVAGALFAAHSITFPLLRLKPRRQRAERQGFLAELVSGVVVAVRMPELLMAAGMVMLSGLVGKSAIEILPAVTGMILGGGAEDYAGLVAASGVGAILAGLAMSLMSNREEAIRLRIFVASLAAMSITGGLGLLDTYAGFLMVCPFLGFFVTMVGASSQSLVQIAVDDDYRGRVLSLWTMASFGGPAIGVLALGAVGQVVGLRLALSIFGMVGLVCVAAGMVLERATRAPR